MSEIETVLEEDFFTKDLFDPTRRVRLRREPEGYVFEHRFVRALIRRVESDYTPGEMVWEVWGEAATGESEFCVDFRTLDEARERLTSIAHRVFHDLKFLGRVR